MNGDNAGALRFINFVGGRTQACAAADSAPASEKIRTVSCGFVSASWAVTASARADKSIRCADSRVPSFSRKFVKGIRSIARAQHIGFGSAPKGLSASSSDFLHFHSHGE
jgi:ABC-type uncharacterized transport system permease subunit